MNKLKKYIQEILGLEIQSVPLAYQNLGNLPMFIGESYNLYEIILFNHILLVAEPKNMENFGIMQTEKHIDLLKKNLNKRVILVLPEITYLNRKRLIEKRISFVIPGKQLFVPDLLLDLRESFNIPRSIRKKETLIPSAQFLLIYFIIHRREKRKFEEHSFKEIAAKAGYSAMSISKAVDNLKYFELIDVIGGKEKFIRFRMGEKALWEDAERRNLLVNPVLKRVYVDEKPSGIFLLPSNISALSEYSNMNPDKQEYYALEKSVYYGLQKNNALLNANENEGRFCLEIWKYNPKLLVNAMPGNIAVVDPLSLYLSLKGTHDERIEIALDQIINEMSW